MPTFPLTVIFGYCGSGKSYLADSLAKDKNVLKIEEGYATDPKYQALLIGALKKKIPCIVSEVRLGYDSTYRQAFISAVSKVINRDDIQWLFLEDDIATANHNCLVRENKSDAWNHIKINQNIATWYRATMNSLSSEKNFEVRPIHRLS